MKFLVHRLGHPIEVEVFGEYLPPEDLEPAGVQFWRASLNGLPFLLTDHEMDDAEDALLAAIQMGRIDP